MAKFETQEAEELLTIDLVSDLPLGPAKLNCSFEGTLNDRLVGFYRSKYTQVLELAVITIFYLGYKKYLNRKRLLVNWRLITFSLQRVPVIVPFQLSGSGTAQR